MKKMSKKIYIAFILIMCLIFSGCNKKAANLDDINRILDENGYNKYGEKETPSPSPTEEPKKGYNIPKKEKKESYKIEASGQTAEALDLMFRVYKFIEAYNLMIVNEEEYAKNVQIDMEMNDDVNNFTYKGDVTTADGKIITDNYAYYASLINWYFEYSNLIIDQYYDLEFNTRLSSSSKNISNYYLTYDGANFQLDQLLLIDGCKLVDYLAHCDSIQPASVEILSVGDYSVSGFDAYYKMRMQCIKDLDAIRRDVDGNIVEEDENEAIDYSLIAYFDIRGNLLNIVVDKDDFPEWDKYMYTKYTYNDDLKSLQKTKLANK